jgi:hypothetical protein
MKGIKKALIFLLGALYASGWWAVSTHKGDSIDTLPVRILLVALTLVLVIVTAWYIIANWDENE